MMGRRWSGTVHSFWSPSRRSALWAVVRFLCGGGAGFSSVELMWGGWSRAIGRQVGWLWPMGCLTERTVYRGDGDDSLY